jgi:hypothetical protein
MSNYDFRPDLAEIEEKEKQLKEKLGKPKKEEENDSIRNDDEVNTA